MKKGFIKAEKYLEKKYGKRGTEKREQFEEETFANYYADILKHRRKELKMTQQTLAEKVGKKRTYISRLENGEDVQLSNFVMVANALGLSLHLTAA